MGNFINNLHYVKSVRIRSYSGPHFPHSDWIWRDTSCIQPELRENVDQNNSEYGHFTQGVGSANLAGSNIGKWKITRTPISN